MKIVDVETYVVGAGWKNWVFVKVLTDEDLYGIGEATLNGFAGTCEAAVQELKPLVIGADPRQIRRNATSLYERVANEGGHVHRTAIAGIEVACWDLLGKSLGVPIHQLLGGQVREHVPCYANGWYRTERSPESFAAAAVAALEKGFMALKFDPLGTARGFFAPGELEASREIVRAVRSSVGRGVRLLIDLHARLAPSEAVAMIDSCSDLDIFWWEEPTTREREEPTSEVARRSVGRIASGENFHAVGQFFTLAKSGGVSIFQPEPMSLGGILPSLAVAAIAAADGAWIAPHQSGGPVATAVCLQLAACVPNFLIQEHFDPFNEPWTRSLVTWAPTLDSSTGELSLPDAPGLGIDLDLEVARAHPYDPAAFLDTTSAGWELRLGQAGAR
ncbi:MAG: mandelate racemase/muconate lactonizing protein [Acidimicrobiaceae bacterium]|jgi:galactonate dehydratase|nr:mandelate racemase/muconate lactonizing protein [Acidimicrobiaceae bacterium]